MYLGFLTAARHWQQHRFLTALLIAAYALGISLTTLIFATISGAASVEQEFALGDPQRVIGASIGGDNPLALDLGAWLDDIPVSWGWVYLGGTGGRLNPSLAGTNVFAMFGTGEVSWQPPLRSGRFLTGADLRQGKKLMVRGEDVSGSLQGFESIGIAYDPPLRERGWSRDVFLPFDTLPSEIKQGSEAFVLLHLEVSRGHDVSKAKATLFHNLTRQLPDSRIQVETLADQYTKASEQFRHVLNRGFAVSAVVLGFVVANVSILSVHWITQRRREIGVRMALGATGRAIVVMVLTEHLLLAGIGGALALPMIYGALTLAALWDIRMEISLGALTVTLCATILGGILSAIPPVYLFFKAPLRENLNYRD